MSKNHAQYVLSFSLIHTKRTYSAYHANCTSPNYTYMYIHPHIYAHTYVCMDVFTEESVIIQTEKLAHLQFLYGSVCVSKISHALHKIKRELIYPNLQKLCNCCCCIGVCVVVLTLSHLSGFFVVECVFSLPLCWNRQSQTNTVPKKRWQQRQTRQQQRQQQLAIKLHTDKREKTKASLYLQLVS